MITDDMVELACRKYYNSGEKVYPPSFEAMRKALESVAALLRGEAPLTGKYGDVLATFVRFMERELRANAHKGDHAGWRSMSRADLLLEVHYHVGKLHWALHHRSMDEVRGFAVDTANMCMMLLDVCGLLLREQGGGLQATAP